MSTISRTCSQCGNNGHNSRTCTDSGGAGAGNDSPNSENGIMLFGVRVTAGGGGGGGGGAFRKSASMNNLSQYDQQNQDSNAEVFAAGYASDDLVHASAGSRDRKRGVPWTEEEHKLFLLGLQKVGKGDWRGISRNFVKSRTPTQVASHAQKYFIRRNNHNRRRRRSSLFDMTTDSVMGTGIPEDQVREDPILLSSQQQSNLSCNMKQFPVLVLPKIGEDSMENLTLGQSNKAKNTTSSSSSSPSPKLIRPIPFFPIPPSSKMAKLNLNETSSSSSGTEALPLSLKLSTTPPPTTTTDEPSPPPSQSAARRSSAFEAISDKFNSSNGDSIISVA